MSSATIRTWLATTSDDFLRRVRRGHLVLARPLGGVERFVGGPHQVLGGRYLVVGQARDAEARGDGPAVREGKGRDDLPDAVRVEPGAGAGGLDEEHHELVPAVAGHDVDTPRVLDQNLRDLPQRLVADGVAQVVVDRLEPVEIHEDHRDRVVEAPMALHLLLDPDREEAAVVTTGDSARVTGLSPPA